MKKILLILITIFFVGSGLKAQSNSSDTIEKNNNDFIFTTVETRAKFPGGLDGWRDYLVKNLNTSVGQRYIKIPKGEKNAKATVIVTFLIDKEGNISKVSADSLSIATIHPKIVAEAIRVFTESPQWIPAWQNGHNVAYRQRQAITFVATKD